MATVPTVQTLDQIMAELQPGYTAQRGVIQKGIQNTNETYKASQLALDAAKTQGFNQINDQATGKGVGRAFSGLPIAEQADYLSTKYLPGLQQAKAQQQADILTLEGQNAALDTDIRNKAFGSRETQQQSLNQWNLQQEAQRAAAEAARLDRDFRASQAERDRAHQAAQAREAAATRAAAKTSSPFAIGGSNSGGYTVFNADGSRANIDLWTYVRSQGGGATDLVGMLATSKDKKDQNAYKNYIQNANKYGANAAFEQLRRDLPTAFYTSK